MRTWILVITVIAAGCGGGKDDSNDKANKPTSDLADEGKSLADEAKALGDKASALGDEAGKLGDRAKESANDLADRAEGAADSAKDFAEGTVGRLGDLAGEASKAGEDAIDRLRPHAAGLEGGIEDLIVGGKQAATKAAAIAAAVTPKIASGIGFRPIYEPIGAGGSKAAIDKAIGAMPRVEMMGGLTVGFKPLGGKREFLVVWRQGDHLVGFVYTPLTDIVIDKLVTQSPRLIGLVRDAL